jgi:chemotaxis protein CheZ
MKTDPYLLPFDVEGAAASPHVFQQLGAITRLLHDTLNQLGVIPRLQAAASGLPDARSRLAYIAKKTGDAAERVLTLVEHAKAEQAGIAQATRHMAKAIAADPVRAVASGSVMNFVGDVESATARVDATLTDIMMAQDFHDLTGQVVAKVVALAGDLEDSLIKLLVQAAPPEQMRKGEGHSVEALQGPQHDLQARFEVVSSQGEVDDLLASLGF